MTAGENVVEYYVLVHLYDGQNLEPRVLQIADTNGKMILGTVTTDEFGMGISTKKKQVTVEQYGHAVVRLAGFPVTIENKLEREAQNFQCFRQADAAKQRAIEMWDELRSSDSFLEPRHPGDVIVENRVGTTLPRRRVSREQLSPVWEAIQVSKDDLMEWNRIPFSEEGFSTIEANFGEAEEFTLVPVSSLVVRLELEEPLREGQAFQVLQEHLDNDQGTARRSYNARDCLVSLDGASGAVRRSTSSNS